MAESNFIMNTHIPSKYTDADLVKSYINGSEIALETLVNRHKLQIFNFINSKINDRDTSEDIFQDTLDEAVEY